MVLWFFAEHALWPNMNILAFTGRQFLNEKKGLIYPYWYHIWTGSIEYFK